MRRLTPDCHDWFFIRYPEAGLHIRIRIGEQAFGAYPALKAQLAADCLSLARREPPSAAVVAFGRADEFGRRFQPGEYCEPPYEPEVRRYGGEIALAENERLFRTSTALAIAAIARTGDNRQKRLSVATDLMLMTAAAIADIVEPRRFLGDYARSWRASWPTTPGIETENLPSAGVSIARLDSFRQRLADDAPPSDLASAWGQALQQSRRQFHKIFEAGQLVSPTSERLVRTDPDYSAAVRSMVASQLHMLNNRLGFWPDGEILMAEWLVAALTKA